MNDYQQRVHDAATTARLPVSEDEVAELARLYPELRAMAIRICALAEADACPAELVFHLDAPTDGSTRT